MAKYSSQVGLTKTDKPFMLVLPPLLVTLVFCYGFAIYQPKSTAANASSSQSIRSTSQATISGLKFSKPSKLPVITNDTTANQATNSGKTIPQSSPSSTQSLQAAGSNDGSHSHINVDSHSGGYRQYNLHVRFSGYDSRY